MDWVDFLDKLVRADSRTQIVVGTPESMAAGTAVQEIKDWYWTTHFGGDTPHLREVLEKAKHRVDNNDHS